MDGREVFRRGRSGFAFLRLRRIVWFLPVGAPVPEVLAGLAVEDDDAPVAVPGGDERLVRLRVHPDARRAAEQGGVVAAVVLVEGADGEQQLPLAREFHHA